MRRGLTLLVAACVIFCLAACTQQPNEEGRTVVVSNGVTYEPLRFGVYMKGASSTVTDGARMQPHEVIEELPAVPYHEDLRLVPGDGETLHSYTLYGSGLAEVYYRQEMFTPPDKPGGYIVSFEAQWSGGGEEHGYQYMFALTISD